MSIDEDWLEEANGLLACVLDEAVHDQVGGGRVSCNDMKRACGAITHEQEG